MTTPVSGNNYYLDKRLKLLRAKDSGLYLYWVDRLQSPDTAPASTPTTVNGISEFVNATSTDTVIPVAPLTEAESVMFFTKVSTNNANLPNDVSGTLNVNVFWAGYIDAASDGSGNQYKPITGAKYFEILPSSNLDYVDLVFWSNVLVDDLPVTGNTNDVNPVGFGQKISPQKGASTSTSTPNTVQDFYTTSLRDSILSNGTANPKTQRVIFYSQGTYKKFILAYSNGAKLATNMYIFSKPILLICAGRGKTTLSDAVYDQIPNYNFMEYTSQ